MGTGIFLWIERQAPEGAWSMVERDESRKPDWQRAFDRETAEEPSSMARHRWQLGKNYHLFAILADHRNHDGKGGRFTEQTISAPRGLPADISDEVLVDATAIAREARITREQRLAFVLQDAVAPSWVTVEELLAVDWDAATHGQGVVGEEGDFLVMLRYEIVPIGPPERVRLVFFFDS